MTDRDEARELFDELIAGGWRCLEQWRDEKRAENERLEFKPKGIPIKAELDPQDKEAIAKTLSAFANTSGGLLVLGIRVNPARKDEPDTIERLEPISNLEAVHAWLDRHAWEFLEPPVGGIGVRAIASTADVSKGAIAIYVPKSEGGPHRVKHATDKVSGRYFMRTTSSSIDMPHDVLADRFGRRPQPRLRLLLKLHGKGGNIQLLVRLRNDGRGTARCPALQFDGIDGRLRWRAIAQSEWHVVYERGTVLAPETVLWQSAPDAMVYPGMILPVVNVEAGTNAGAMDGETIRGAIYAADAMPVEFSVTLRLGEDIEVG